MFPTAQPNWAFLIVDPQVDFCPGGALPVPGGDGIFPAVNEVAKRAPLVIASRDWHPVHHASFTERGGPWPPHCVQGTEGAEFHPALDRKPIAHVFSKGQDPDLDAYSAFDGTGLADWLREHGVESLLIGGLATDYCVRASVLDALSAGFPVSVLEDGVGAVDVKPGDGARALNEMRERGAEMVRAWDTRAR
ncbi:MAG: bifunctional nicotinamidase/pyrazinamidase [Candidatus Dormibacteraeota bacterium]|nr:bifunctional nicotinamidase/pyrazinamidase [Candidatus Dormibacteraeota bacterium]